MTGDSPSPAFHLLLLRVSHKISNVFSYSQPELETHFFQHIRKWFGNINDLKFVVKSCPALNHRAGLSACAVKAKQVYTKL